MNLEGMSKKQLLDLVIELASSLKEEDLFEPDTYSLVSQLLSILDDSGDSLPQELIDQLSAIKDPKQRFIQAIQSAGLSDESQFDSLAQSMKKAGLLKNEDLAKASAIDVTNSHILMFPAKLNGSHTSEHPDIPPYHVTLKWLGTDKPMEHDKVQDLVDKYKLNPPTPKKLVPDIWKSPRGDIHVLKLEGDHENIHGAHEDMSQEQKSLHPFVPHITVSKELHDKVKNENLTPEDLGLEVGPLEYRIGNQTIKKFHPAPEAEVHVTKSLLDKAHSTLMKISELAKAINGDWKDDKKYRFVHREFKGGRGQSIRVYHGTKRVGHMAFSSRTRNDGYHEVFNSEIDPEHRGKGLYQEMIRRAGDKSIERGGKGVKSEGYQRSGDATRVWDKVATHAEPYTNNAKIKGSTSQKDSDYFYTPELKKGARGDWEKDNSYEFDVDHDEAYDSISKVPYNRTIVKVKHYPSEVGRGASVAHGAFRHTNDGLKPDDIFVHEDHRRKGIANEMYRLAEEHSGKKIAQSDQQSPDAKALWNQPNRPFGKSELKKGQNGDWEKEGYTIHHSFLHPNDDNAWDAWENMKGYGPATPEITSASNDNDGYHSPPAKEIRQKLKSGTHRLVHAHSFAYAKDKNGNPVGGAYIAYDGEIMGSGVHKDHRRKGIATALYQKLAENNNGHIMRGGSQTDDAASLWEGIGGNFKKTKLLKSETIQKARQVLKKIKNDN